MGRGVGGFDPPHCATEVVMDEPYNQLLADVYSAAGKLRRWHQVPGASDEAATLIAALYSTGTLVDKLVDMLVDCLEREGHGD